MGLFKKAEPEKVTSETKLSHSHQYLDLAHEAASHAKELADSEAANSLQLAQMMAAQAAEAQGRSAEATSIVTMLA